MEFSILKSKTYQKIKIESTYIDSGDIGVEDLLYKEMNVFRAKKRIQFLQVSAKTVDKRILTANHFKPASKFADGLIAQ